MRGVRHCGSRIHRIELLKRFCFFSRVEQSGIRSDELQLVGEFRLCGEEFFDLLYIGMPSGHPNFSEFVKLQIDSGGEIDSLPRQQLLHLQVKRVDQRIVLPTNCREITMRTIRRGMWFGHVPGRSLFRRFPHGTP